MSNSTPRTITIAPNRYNEVGHYESPVTLRTHSRYIRSTVRLGIGYIGPDGVGRREFGADPVPGPWAYTYPHATVIDNFGGTGAEAARNEAAGTEWVVEAGDEFVIDGRRFRLTDDRPHTSYPALTLVEGEA
jgi:hypothetical protein